MTKTTRGKYLSCITLWVEAAGLSCSTEDGILGQLSNEEEMVGKLYAGGSQRTLF